MKTLSFLILIVISSFYSRAQLVYKSIGDNPNNVSLTLILNAKNNFKSRLYLNSTVSEPEVYKVTKDTTVNGIDIAYIVNVNDKKSKFFLTMSNDATLLDFYDGNQKEPVMRFYNDNRSVPSKSDSKGKPIDYMSLLRIFSMLLL